MSPEQQRIKIAEACGWEHIREREFGRGLVGVHPTIKDHCGIYDYLSDLNAMHEAERVLGEKLNDYTRVLSLVANTPFTVPLVCATAAQRAEAFLKTLNLWADKK